MCSLDAQLKFGVVSFDIRRGSFDVFCALTRFPYSSNNFSEYGFIGKTKKFALLSHIQIERLWLDV